VTEQTSSAVLIARLTAQCRKRPPSRPNQQSTNEQTIASLSAEIKRLCFFEPTNFLGCNTNHFGQE
jgi:hypothetical protein